MVEHYRFGGGVAETTLHPLVLVATVIAIILILMLPRKYAVIPFLVIVLLTPLGQVVVLGGIHLMVSRIVTLFVWLRLVKARFMHELELLPGGFTHLDKLFLLWAVGQAVVFTLQYLSKDAFINQCGFLLDSVGAYFVLRYFIQDDQSIETVIKTIGVVVVVVAAGMLVEQSLHNNIFGTLGGVAAAPAIRDGRTRSQGVFQHAILAGVFGATVLPLFLWLWRFGRAKLVSGLALIGSVVMVLTSGSSTPVLTLLGGLLGMCLWPMRNSMRLVRWGLVIAILASAVVMNAPVWFILAHVDVVGSSSGYQRAMLIDQFVNHFSDWWLLGSNGNENWGWDMWDIQNQFVAQGETGGLISFVLFIWIIVSLFRHLGVTRRLMVGDRQQEWLIWTLGAVLVAHVIAFLGANYFDQTKIWWFAFPAMVCAVARAHQPTSAAEIADSQVGWAWSYW